MIHNVITVDSDQGVVAVLDSRLSTKKSYRWDLIKALPDFTRTSDPEVAMERLRTIAAAGDADTEVAEPDNA